MFDYDPKTSLMHWPTPMARFGKNQYGENKYRIVFAPSRRHIIYGQWNGTGAREAHWVEKYPEVGMAWILEAWCSPFKYTGFTKDQWESAEMPMPWPERGDYECAYVFDACGIADANLEKLISWIEMGQDYSYAENRVACQKNFDYEEKEKRRIRHDMIDDRLRAFGTGPLSGYGGGRNTKTYPILKSAEELGLPTQPGMSSVRPKRKQKFEIPLGA